jgi:hypothetical protein
MDPTVTLTALREATDQVSVLQKRIESVLKHAPKGSEEWVSVGGPSLTFQLLALEDDVKNLRKHMENYAAGRKPEDQPAHASLVLRYQRS